jgi:hypothetical protein
MEKATFLLFEKLYNGKPLFASQVDIVQDLLSNPHSGYYVSEADSDAYKRDTNKLKSYLSQLLSDSVSRSITSVLKNSLRIIVESRLKNTQFDASEISANIIASLEEKNSRQFKSSDVEFNTVQELLINIRDSDYILVITARPFDISTNSTEQSLQQFLIADLLSNIGDSKGTLKRYRFNFPLMQLCELFWISLKKVLDAKLLERLNFKGFVDAIYLKSLIPHGLFEELVNTQGLTKELISRTADSILYSLGKSLSLQVYLVEEPIFSVPMIVIDPNKRASFAYLILEGTNESYLVHRLGLEDILIWKFFVWDKLKTRGLGKSIEFNSKLV